MSKNSEFYIDEACVKCKLMWIRLGRKLEKLALQSADDTFLARRSVEIAQLAEACFWQAAGENPTPSVAHLLGMKGEE